MNKTYHYIAEANAGKSEQQRLALQNEIFSPGTEAFLTPFLKPGVTVLVVGCGTGEETCFIAKAVGATGKVIAIDLNEKQLEQAKIKLKENAITNVTLRQMDLMDMSSLPDSFDLAFSRFVLVHIQDPVAALNCMRSKLKPGGRLACEEPVISAAYSTPENPAFIKHIELLMQYGNAIGADFDLGNRLKELFVSVVLKNVSEQIFQPIMTTAEQKLIVPLSAAACSNGYLAQELTTEKDMTVLIKKLDEEIVCNTNVVVGQPRVHQVTGIIGKK